VDAATVAEMVVNVQDSPVEHLMSHDIVLLPKLVTVRPAVDQTPSSSSTLPSSVAAADMHQYNNKVITSVCCTSCNLIICFLNTVVLYRKILSAKLIVQYNLLCIFAL